MKKETDISRPDPIACYNPDNTNGMYKAQYNNMVAQRPEMEKIWNDREKERCKCQK
jgi:hypothetical protein